VPQAVPWLRALRRYLLVLAGANLAWEVVQLPLYTIWREGTPGEIAFAVLHCTGGDVLIGLASLTLALIVAAGDRWPLARYGTVAALTIAAGLIYTIFSEWLNISVRQAWAYSDLMPVIPLIDTGLSPFAQWIVVPLLAFSWAARLRRPSNQE
jgi:hypothetical protein